MAGGSTGYNTGGMGTDTGYSTGGTGGIGSHTGVGAGTGAGVGAGVGAHHGHHTGAGVVPLNLSVILQISATAVF